MNIIRDIFYTFVLSMGILAAIAIVIMILEFIASVIPVWVAMIIIALIMVSVIIAVVVIVFMCLRNAVNEWRNS